MCEEDSSFVIGGNKPRHLKSETALTAKIDKTERRTHAKKRKQHMEHERKQRTLLADAFSRLNQACEQVDPFGRFSSVRGRLAVLERAISVIKRLHNDNGAAQTPLADGVSSTSASSSMSSPAPVPSPSVLQLTGFASRNADPSQEPLNLPFAERDERLQAQANMWLPPSSSSTDGHSHSHTSAMEAPPSAHFQATPGQSSQFPFTFPLSEFGSSLPHSVPQLNSRPPRLPLPPGHSQQFQFDVGLRPTPSSVDLRLAMELISAIQPPSRESRLVSESAIIQGLLSANAAINPMQATIATHAAVLTPNGNGSTRPNVPFTGTTESQLPSIFASSKLLSHSQSQSGPSQSWLGAQSGFPVPGVVDQDFIERARLHLLSLASNSANS